MRRSFIGLLLVFGACGGGSTVHHDLAAAGDLSTSTDLSAVNHADQKIVTPYDMPGSIFCYGSAACSSMSATPVCCDAAADGGFADTCVASTTACTSLGASAHAYACGQAADCASGQVCCGATGTSSSGSTHFTGTTCETSCAAGETQLCVTASECKTSGAQCTGQSISGRDVGLCQ